MNIWKLLPTVILLALPFVALAEDAKRFIPDMFGGHYETTEQPANAAPTIDKATNVSVTPTPAATIPEEARKHFVRGAALFKDAKTAEDYAQVMGEFQQAADLAPQWPEARYNLALSKEATGDYSGAMADLKRYQAFTLSETEARTVQDKIYALEVKAETANKKKAEEQAVAAAAQRAADEVLAKQRQTKEVMARLKAIVGGAYYDRKSANYKNPFTEGGAWPGVNAAEKKGKCWYNTGNRCQKYVFEDDRVLICFVSDAGGVNQEHPSLIGTPNGPSLQDIVWTMENKKKVWFNFDDETGEIAWSPDRPVNDSEFDPNTRYGYWSYRRSN